MFLRLPQTCKVEFWRELSCFVIKVLSNFQTEKCFIWCMGGECSIQFSAISCNWSVVKVIANKHYSVKLFHILILYALGCVMNQDNWSAIWHCWFCDRFIFGLFDSSTTLFLIASVASFDCLCNRDFGAAKKKKSLLHLRKSEITFYSEKKYVRCIGEHFAVKIMLLCYLFEKI